MATARALLVGLTSVDPNRYGGWDGRNGCAGCEIDVDNIHRLLEPLGYKIRELKTAEARHDVLLDELRRAARKSSPGDIFVFYYSGHGGQQPDRDGDELDGHDETLIAYDRPLVDDYLNEVWLSFQPGVRIVMVSDSCNSGTNYRNVFTVGSGTPMDPIDRSTGHRMAASMIHMGGCRDSSESMGYQFGGAFTTALCKCWDKGDCAKTYPLFYEAVRRRVLATEGVQDPAYNEYGSVGSFRQQSPFTVESTGPDDESESGKPDSDERHDPTMDAGRGLRVDPGAFPLGRGASLEGLRLHALPTRDAPTPPPDLTLNDLNQAVNRAYDLSVSMAANLNIPVAGSVGGNYSRRVVVLERSAYLAVPDPSGNEHRWGYAIRMCVTVAKVNADLKLSLPFLAANAQLGRVEASWLLQVVGLAGPKMDAVAETPTELDVETFVLAKQSIVKLINAVRDPTTRFHPLLVSVKLAEDAAERAYRESVPISVALDGLAEGRSLNYLLTRLNWADEQFKAVVESTYREFAGDVAPNQPPPKSASTSAAAFVGKANIRPR